VRFFTSTPVAALHPERENKYFYFSFIIEGFLFSIT
jgi:hypothetical protein